MDSNEENVDNKQEYCVPACLRPPPGGQSLEDIANLEDPAKQFTFYIDFMEFLPGKLFSNIISISRSTGYIFKLAFKSKRVLYRTSFIRLWCL